MDFPQVEEQFKALKEQFTAGKLDEAAFKAQLNELMVQDGQGRWWMIGYETGQWYMHDGTAWVRADPPARAPAKPSIPPPEPIKIQAEPGPAVQPAAPAAELLAGKPEEPQAVQGRDSATRRTGGKNAGRFCPQPGARGAAGAFGWSGLRWRIVCSKSIDHRVNPTDL